MQGAGSRFYPEAMQHPCYCVLLRSAARKVTAVYDAALEPVGLSVAQYSLLRTVEQAQPVSLTEIGRRTELDRSTIGRNVKLLQRRGFVAVKPGNDQREATVVLAEAGESALRDGLPLWNEAQSKIETSMGPQFVGQLRSFLEVL